MLSDYFKPEEINELETLAKNNNLIKRLMKMQEETLDPGNYLRNQCAKLCIRFGVTIESYLNGEDPKLLSGKKAGSQLESLMLIIDKMPKLFDVVEKRPGVSRNMALENMEDLPPIRRSTNGASQE